MTAYDDLKALVVLWIGSVARMLLNVSERVAAPRAVRLIEGDDGTFRIDGVDAPGSRIIDGKPDGEIPPALAQAIKGSRAELVLQPKRFLFRPLELPRRAGEFLDGIVRAQIDRLTPWSPQDVAFGRTQPVDIAGDRIGLTVAATGRAAIAPFVATLSALGARAVKVSTSYEQAGTTTTISIVEEVGRDGSDLARLQQALQVVLLAALILTAVTLAAASFLGSRLADEQTEVSARINTARAALMAGHDVPGGAAATERALATRKHETPSSVITLEALSRVLPDNTYLTELQIAGDKMQIVGLTRNAPALIPLIEQSPHFAHATFFAPTTQPANDPREHFHIETRLRPVFTPGT
jgi:general secretion pathway protein L